MRKLALMSGASMMALTLAHPAMAGDFADLCGTIVDSDTELNGITDSFAGNCTIEVEDGVKLAIKSSDLTVTGDLIIQSDTLVDDDDASIEIKYTAFTVDGFMDVKFEDGKVEITRNNLFDTSDTISIGTEDGNIEIKDSEFDTVNDSFNVRATGSGKIEISDNIIQMSESISIEAQNGSIEIAGNDFTTFSTNEEISINTTSGKIEVKDNVGTLGEDHTISIDSDTGRIEVKDNFLAMESGSLRIDSGGKVEVKDNDFEVGLSGPSATTVSGTPCETKDNTPMLSCT